MLQLGGVETERPHRLLWDINDAKQVKEVEAEIEVLKKRGFILEHKEPGSATLNPPPSSLNISVMRILTENGDDRLVWDRTIATQVKEAMAKFKDLVKKGFTPYAIKSDGGKGHKLDDFDPLAGEIVMVPAVQPG